MALQSFFQMFVRRQIEGGFGSFLDGHAGDPDDDRLQQQAEQVVRSPHNHNSKDEEFEDEEANGGWRTIHARRNRGGRKWRK